MPRGVGAAHHLAGGGLHGAGGGRQAVDDAGDVGLQGGGHVEQGLALAFGGAALFFLGGRHQLGVLLVDLGDARLQLRLSGLTVEFDLRLQLGVLFRLVAEHRQRAGDAAHLVAAFGALDGDVETATGERAHQFGEPAQRAADEALTDHQRQRQADQQPRRGDADHQLDALAVEFLQFGAHRLDVGGVGGGEGVDLLAERLAVGPVGVVVAPHPGFRRADLGAQARQFLALLEEGVGVGFHRLEAFGLVGADERAPRIHDLAHGGEIFPHAGGELGGTLGVLGHVDAA